MTNDEPITKQHHEQMMANAIWFTRIDAAIADAKFEATKMGKDQNRFVDPLDFALQICRDILIGAPPVPPKEDAKKPED